jgi:branched-chain amino acid transport system permease protein
MKEAMGAQGRLGRGALSRDLWIVRALISSLLLSTVLTVAVLALHFGGDAVTQNVVMIFLVNLVVAVGLQTFTGNSGVVSFGHVAFMGIAAYATAIVSAPPAIKATLIPDAPTFLLEAELPLVPALLVAIAVTVAIAAPVGFVFVRLSGAAAAISTLAWLVIVRTVIANWDTLTAGTFTFYGLPPYTTIWWALGLAILAITAARLFRESGLGLALRASSNDELVARAVGVNMTIARVAAWVLSAAIAAMGGFLYAHHVLALAPNAFYFQLTFLILVMVIVGGSSVSGAVVGAASISVIAEVLRRAETATGRFGISAGALAVIFVVMMILRSKGLLGRWELDELLVRGRRRWRRGRGSGGRSESPAPVDSAADGRSSSGPAGAGAGEDDR